MSNEKALDGFLAVKNEIDGYLKKLSALSKDHFGVAPHDLNWGHVGSLQKVADLLKEAADHYAR